MVGNTHLVLTLPEVCASALTSLPAASSVSFLGVMCSRILRDANKDEDVLGECPLPAIKVSLDWLRLRPSVFHEAAVEQRQQ